MPEKITKDTGMLQHTVDSFRMDDPQEVATALNAWADSIPDLKPDEWVSDAIRRENADRCRAILATVGLRDEGKTVLNTAPLRKLGLTEDSAVWIAAHWLTQNHVITRIRQEIMDKGPTPDDLSRLLMAAEELGRLQERMWWRAGIDPESGKRRESLALSGRAQTKAGQQGRAMRSDNSFAAAHGIAAQKFADDIAAKNPSLSWAAIRNIVASKFKVSSETVKKSLRNPKRGR